MTQLLSNEASRHPVQQRVGSDICDRMLIPMIMDRTTLLYNAATLLLVADTIRKTDNNVTTVTANKSCGDRAVEYADSSTTGIIPNHHQNQQWQQRLLMAPIHRVVSGNDFHNINAGHTDDDDDDTTNDQIVITPTLMTPSYTDAAAVISPVPHFDKDPLIGNGKKLCLLPPSHPPRRVNIGQSPAKPTIRNFSTHHHQQKLQEGQRHKRTWMKPSTSSLSSLLSHPAVLVDTPHKNDVLLGKGKCYQNHYGNKLFRHLVEAFRARYDNATRKTIKTQVATEIVSLIHNTYGGKFLEQQVVVINNQHGHQHQKSQSNSTMRTATTTTNMMGKLAVWDDNEDGDKDDDNILDDDDGSSGTSSTDTSLSDDDVDVIVKATTTTAFTTIGWVEVDDRRAREKVALCFRSKRRQQRVVEQNDSTNNPRASSVKTKDQSRSRRRQKQYLHVTNLQSSLSSPIAPSHTDYPVVGVIASG